MEANTGREVISARVYCAGVKRRCRKPDNHSLKLGDFPMDTADDRLVRLAVEAVNAQIKELYRQHGKLAPVRLSLSIDRIREEAGLLCRTFTLGDKRARTIDITNHFQ